MVRPVARAAIIQSATPQISTGPRGPDEAASAGALWRTGQGYPGFGCRDDEGGPRQSRQTEIKARSVHGFGPRLLRRLPPQLQREGRKTGLERVARLVPQVRRGIRTS